MPSLLWGSVVLFGGVTLLLIAAAAWEWSRMNGQTQGFALIWAAVSFLIGAGFLTIEAHNFVRLPVLWMSLVALWVIVSSYLLKCGIASWQSVPQVIRLVLGQILIFAAWLALVELRNISLNMLLSALLLVWTADSCAYAVGRLWGQTLFRGRKLAISISPGKTWGGVLGGFGGVAVVGSFWIYFDQTHHAEPLSLYTLLWQHGLWVTAAGVSFLTTLAVVGDLIESLVKRSAGVKDSSHLLPGHGGVLDRIDALLPTLPAVMALACLL